MSVVLGLVNRLTDTAIKIGNTILLPVGGAIVVLALLWGGVQYAQGNAEAGKKTITAAIIGLVIIAVASLLVSLANQAVLQQLPTG
ncbi:hypothetical protein JXA59_00140 [Patescibacteria group bacterium]|nr:hypothetical protein [Patescibacteria group bacterium]